MTRRAWFVLALLLASAGCGPRGLPSPGPRENAERLELVVDSVRTIESHTDSASYGAFLWLRTAGRYVRTSIGPVGDTVVVSRDTSTFESPWRRIR